MQILRCVGTNWIITLSEKNDAKRENMCNFLYEKLFENNSSMFLSFSNKVGTKIWDRMGRGATADRGRIFVPILPLLFFFFFSLPLNPQNIHTCNISTLDIRIM